MTFQITTTAEAAAASGVKVLVHSRAGMGKTTLCATAPNPLIVSAEAGLLSLRHLRLPVIEVQTMAQLGEVYLWLCHSQEARQFQTVCLDSISEIAEIVLTTEKGASKDPRKAYGEMQDHMTGVIRDFRNLPGWHVYFSAKQTGNKDEMTGVTLYGPDMPGRQLAPQLPYFFDEVFCLDIARTPEGREFRYLRTKTNLQYEAKDRSGALAEFEEPHLANVFSKILQGSATQ